LRFDWIPATSVRVIGKGGRNIEAIRSLVKASAIKEHHRVNVEVIADDDEREPYIQADEGEPVTAGAPIEDTPAGAEPPSPEAVEE